MKWAAVLLVCAVGCSKTADSQLRTSSPAEAAAKTMEIYDANGDGRIGAEEMQASPALIDSLPRIDRNGDHAIDLSEMEARFMAHESMSDIVAVQLTVTAKRAPLVGAEVTLTPEPFMGEGKQLYKGMTSDGGDCALVGEVTPMPGLPQGFYKVHIIHPSSGVDVTLGCEIADDASANRMAFDVKAGSKP